MPASEPTHLNAGVPALDRTSCGDADVSERREWLVTNGLGGFACGTVAGSLTRRYHGLLFAARRPPVGRVLLCPKLDAEIRYDGVTYALATDRWRSGAVAPRGYVLLTAFRVERGIPVWTYTCGDAMIERRVWMEHGANRTFVRHTVTRARTPAGITVRAFANHRELHALTFAGDWRMEVQPVAGGLRVVPFPGAAELWLCADRGSATAEHVWYRDFDYPRERERGLEANEDHLRVGSFDATLSAGESFTISAGDAAAASEDGRHALARAERHADELLRAWRAGCATAAAAPEWIASLVLAADQFIVTRAYGSEPGGRSVIAGYPWFGDWGRDTAIALPGLTLATGRPDVARAILRTFAQFVDDGLLPNAFGEDGSPAAYNTVDAALWYVEAVRRYLDATLDLETARAIFPALRAIVDAYVAGTRYAIVVDAADGLLRAGEPGVQLTWMDAKVGDWVVTPRIGKPVEVNALWINALRACAQIAAALGRPADDLAEGAARAERGFERFWSSERGWCFDVIDGPQGDDPSLRPNQLFAVALPIDVLDGERRRRIVEVCAQRLWTPAGLRTLAPGDPSYVGTYGGDRRSRDGAYHQGTVWTWLAGPFATALARVRGDARAGLDVLASLADGLGADALGTLSEIADGDAPFAARGAFAQAWSVATALDAWSTLTAQSPS